MKIVIAGGTGFLGRALADRLSRDGHDLVILTRGSHPASGRIRFVSWSPDGGVAEWAAELEGAGAVVNLAGESIAGKRWSAARKQQILDSRLHATRSLAAAISQAARPPACFVSGSAVGYYGPHGDDVVTEATPAGTDFLAGVCVKWEREAEAAASARTRVALIRTGLVLERDGGALPQMLPPFRLGVGGRVGSGRQYWPWIHRADWVDLVCWALASDAAAGPLNATAPQPVPNAEFARALGRALRRPALVPAPAFALRIALGELADVLLLSGQRAVPARASALGFAFNYGRLDEALAAIFTRR
jgi:uncharacterized protein (TIGR01777 family)